MAAPTIDQVKNDPEFYELPIAEQEQRLRSIDPDFKSLSRAQQREAILQINHERKRGMKLRSSHEPRLLYQTHKPAQQIQAEKQKIKRAASGVYTPLLEAVGGAGGALLASPGLLTTVPGLLTTAAGGIGGYMFGRRAAKTIDEAIGIREPVSTTELAKETAEDLYTGALYEMGGMSAMVALRPVLRGGKFVFRKAKEGVQAVFSGEFAKKKAGEILIANTSGGTIFAENAEQAAKIEKEIPGIKFTLGQRTYDPATIKLERTQFRKPGPGAQQSAEQIAQNNKALRAYYEKTFAGEEGIDDLISNLRAAQQRIATKAEAEAVKPTGALPAEIPEPQEAGRAIVEQIETAKGPVQTAMGELEAAIPDYPMKFDAVRKSIYNATKNPKLSAGQRRAVERFSKEFEEMAGRGESTHRAFGIRRTLNDEINKAYAQGNDSSAAIMLELKEALENDLSSVASLARTGEMATYKGKAIFPDELARELERNAQRIAHTKAKEVVDVETMARALNEKGIPAMKVPHEGQAQYTAKLSRDYERLIKKEIPIKTQKVDQGIIHTLTERNKAIIRILDDVSPGQDVAAAMNAYNEYASKQYFGRFDVGAVKRATIKGVKPENIPAYFTSATGADELIKAIGKDKASEIMKGFYSYDLLQNATDPITGNIVTPKLYRWLNKKDVGLKKYNLRQQFKGVTKAQQIADAAQKAATDFERSAAARLLKADPEFAIRVALSGNAPGKETALIMKNIGDDKTALKGLQNAYAEHFTKEIETTIPDIAGGTISAHNKFKRIMDKFSHVSPIIYSKDAPEKLKALETMRKAYEISIRNKSSPIGGGSDTAENILTQIGDINILSRPVIIAKGIFRAITKYTDKQVDDLMVRALFDPDYAEVLIHGARGKIKPEELTKTLNGKIVKLEDISKRISEQAMVGTGIAGQMIPPGQSVIPMDRLEMGALYEDAEGNRKRYIGGERQWAD
jgi:hypothetical protein